MLDDIDRAIVGMLQTDATLAYADLGERVGLSASTINDRLKRLRAKGVIRRISAEIDPHALGLDLMVIVLVEIGGIEAERAFLAAMQGAPSVMECHHISGDFSYLLKVRVASTTAYEDFLNSNLKNLAGIRRTQSLIALSSPKDSHALPVVPRGDVTMDALMRDIFLAAKGIGIGFAVAAPVGPIGMLCIRLTLEKGRLAGFCGGLGAAVADTIFAVIGAFAIIGAFGLTAGGSSIEAYRVWFELGGGLFLVAFGVHLGMRRPIIASDDDDVPQTLFADFARTLVLTLANPVTILSFIAIFAGVPGMARIELAMMPLLTVGVFVGSAGWWLTLSIIVGLVRHMISETVFIWLNRIAGGLLVAFGFYTLMHLAGTYLGGGQ